MFKKTLAILGTLTFFSLTLTVTAFADTEVARCGFFAKLFGNCQSTTGQTANLTSSFTESRLKEKFNAELKKIATTTNPTTLAQIQCVGSAVAVREASLSSSMTTYTESLNSAYSKRASDLATAYSKTTISDLRTGIKTAWTTFNTSTKTAQKSWRTTKETAWNTFKTAVKSCRSTESVSDSANAVTEMSGE